MNFKMENICDVKNVEFKYSPLNVIYNSDKNVTSKVSACYYAFKKINSYSEYYQDNYEYAVAYGYVKSLFPNLRIKQKNHLIYSLTEVFKEAKFKRKYNVSMAKNDIIKWLETCPLRKNKLLVLKSTNIIQLVLEVLRQDNSIIEKDIVMPYRVKEYLIDTLNFREYLVDFEIRDLSYILSKYSKLINELSIFYITSKEEKINKFGSYLLRQENSVDTVQNDIKSPPSLNLLIDNVNYALYTSKNGIDSFKNYRWYLHECILINDLNNMDDLKNYKDFTLDHNSMIKRDTLRKNEFLSTRFLTFDPFFQFIIQKINVKLQGNLEVMRNELILNKFNGDKLKMAEIPESLKVYAYLQWIFSLKSYRNFENLVLENLDSIMSDEDFIEFLNLIIDLLIHLNTSVTLFINDIHKMKIIRDVIKQRRLIKGLQIVELSQDSNGYIYSQVHEKFSTFIRNQFRSV